MLTRRNLVSIIAAFAASVCASYTLTVPKFAAAGTTVADGTCYISNVTDITADLIACQNLIEANPQIGRIQLPPGGHNFDPLASRDGKPGFNFCSTKRFTRVVGGNSTVLYPSAPPAGTKHDFAVRLESPTGCEIEGFEIDNWFGMARIGLYVLNASWIDRITIKDAAYAGLYVSGSTGASWGNIRIFFRPQMVLANPPYHGAVFQRANMVQLQSLGINNYTGDCVRIAGNNQNIDWVPQSYVTGDGYINLLKLGCESQAHHATTAWPGLPDNSALYYGIHSFGSNRAQVHNFHIESDTTSVMLENNTQHFKLVDSDVLGPSHLPWLRIESGSHSVFSGIAVAGQVDTEFSRAKIRPRDSDGTWVSVWNAFTDNSSLHSWSAQSSYHRPLTIDFVDSAGITLWTAYSSDRGLLAEQTPPDGVLYPTQDVVWSRYPRDTTFLGWQYDQFTAHWEPF